jgi:tetratricopeptide (TPR) repeat protein
VSQSDFVSRGQALVAAGQFQEAVKVCRLGLLGRPTTVEGRVVLGQALLALKRFDEVLAEMRVALELDHSSVQAQVLKAEALLRKGDTAPAIETLHKARQAAPGDPRIMQLLGEAENNPSRPSVTHPAVGFVGSGDTKHYPGHSSGSGDEESGPDSYTIPTSLDSPGGARRSSQKRAVEPEPAPMPAPKPAPKPAPAPAAKSAPMAAAKPAPMSAAKAAAKPAPAAAPAPVFGERTGTVEVDPELEGVEVDDEDDLDFDDLAAPPRATQKPAIGGPRGAVVSSRTDDDDDEDDATREGRPRGGGPARKPGPALGDLAARGQPKSVPPPRSKAPSQAPPAGARSPVGGPPAAPLPPAPMSPVAPPPAAPAPSPFAQTMLAPPSRSAMPMAPPPPRQQEQLFGNPSGAPAWGSAPPPVEPRPVAPPPEPRPAELDPHILALMSGQPKQPTPPPSAALDQPIGTPPKGAMKTGMRKSRSRLALVMWVVVGIVVIGGGVFAGFQIRAMRLEKQIVAARQRATDLAKADTWKGWREARDSLAGIVQASPTVANRAALARTRALIAFEFGDGIVDAKRDLEELAGQGGFDAQVAAAYLALAQHDIKAAKLAVAALGGAGDDPAVHYLTGEVALLAGDSKAAVTHLKAATDREARPLYGVGYAYALASSYSWDDSLAALERVFAGTADHPSAVIARAHVLALSGRIAPNSSLGNELKAQLERVVAQGKRPLGEQQHGVSPAQVAFGHVVLAQVNFLRNDPKARNELKTALAVNLDDQMFAEEVVETLFMLGDFATTRSAADKALADWPSSKRARIALARVMLAQGRAIDAIDILSKQADVVSLPDALALRGQAYLTAGDVASAARDFDAALKMTPSHEPALIGRAWVELASGEVDAATKRVAERYNPKGSSVGLTTVYAATLRRSADAATRDKAKELLEKVAQGAVGLELARVQLELARLYRDLGDYRSARPAYSAAATAGNLDARLEYGLLLIEDRDPNGGRETLDALLREAGERPTPQLVIEAARARMLAGDHTNASVLLEQADRMAGTEKWKLDRERGRLALRQSQFPAAAAALTRALDASGGDAETFLLAADVGVYEKPLADKVKKLAAERLKGRPEAKIVEGKMLIVAEKYPEAEEAYRAAKVGLKNEKASPRRLAQADFGLGLVAYIRENFVEALQTFELVMDQDPSLVDTYAFASEITKDPRRSLQFAQNATRYNPDYPYAWLLVGKAAHRLRDRKSLTAAINRLAQIAPDGDELKELKTLR